MNWFILTLIGLTACDAYKILCLLPYPGKSHHLFFEPLIEELAHRRHNVTVVSFFPAQQPHPNRRDVSLVGLAPLNIEVVDLKDSEQTFFGLERYYEHIPLVLALAKSNLKLCEKLLHEKVFEEFVKGEGDYDVILVEHFNSNCMLGLVHNYGLPSVGVTTSTMMPWTFARAAGLENPSYTPQMTLPVTEEMTFFERLENTFMSIFYNIWFDMMIRSKEQDILEKRLGRKLPWLEDVARNSSVVMVNSYHALNGVRVLPPAIVEVGGLHLHNRTVQPLPSELENWMSDAKDGVVLFSFGSLIRGSTLPKKSLRAIVNVFARLPQRVLWKWESEEIEDLPPNVRIIRWLPQYDLLNHPKCVAFITHGGLLSLTEAVSAGVPMLAVPVLGDQFGNAAHAQRAGIARVLHIRDFQEHRLKEALDDVLSKKMRERAKLVSSIWRSRPVSPMDLAVHHVEHTARFGGPHLSSHARWLSFYQIALLDVAGFVIVLIFLLVMAVKYVCRCRPQKKLKQS